MDAYNIETLEFFGRKFEVALYSDPDSGPPWEDDDGAGIVRTAYSYYGRPEKQPGEVIMHSNRGDHWLYDFAGSMAKAKEQGWGLGPKELEKLTAELGRPPTKGEILEASVRSNMDFYRRWLDDDWWWCGVCVRIIGPDGEPEGDEYDHALWRVESDGDYWKEVAKELASEIIRTKRKEWLAALHEARQRRYWASRDIVTV